jgi:transcriptional repressor of dcmA and dcmR
VGQRRRRRFRLTDLQAFLEVRPAGRAAREQPPVPIRPRRSQPSDRGINVGGVSLRYGTHLSALYSDDIGRVRLAAGFLADGLRARSVCFLVAEPKVRADILTYLGHQRMAVQIRAGHLVLSDYAATPEAQYDYFESNFVDALAAGAESLRAVGDVGPLTRRVTREQIVQYEAGYDRLIAPRFPVVTLCLYDARTSSGLDVHAVLSVHKDNFRYPVERLLA